MKSDHLKKSAIISLIAALLAALAIAQTPGGARLPDTPAGKTFAAFLVALNSGSLEQMRRFHSERNGQVDNAEQDMQFYDQSGGLVLHSVKQSSDYEIATLVQTKKDGRWLVFKMNVEATAPYPPTTIKVEPAEAPSTAPRESSAGDANKKAEAAAAPARRLAEAEVSASLTAYLEGLAKEDKFSGVVLVAKDGKPFLVKAYGLADKSKGVPINAETKFNLGSMNKMFTAVAIAQLAEQGKLSFDDKVGKLLPDYPNKDVANKVTVRHLLTHTSGLGSYWNAKFDARRAQIKTVGDYLTLFADEPLLFEPGARFEYSNSGFIVLGAIIEKVSGQSYYDYVREHVYKPAGMSGTDAYQITDDTPNLAMGYTSLGPDDKPSSGLRRENTSTRPNRGGPAGGGYSTAGDLLRFATALTGNKLLSAKSTELITTGKVEMGRGGSKYGYGFGEQQMNGYRIFGHNGGAPGIASDLTILPEPGYVAVVMTNYDPPLMMPVVRKIRELLTQGH
ncbi:MAG TPA: serine hydrolase domain-containing protein [Blastocatellia bacterium]|nr:serine hydrolase domain-containing protein [Blastocatellia bacterium]